MKILCLADLHDNDDLYALLALLKPEYDYVFIGGDILERKRNNRVTNFREFQKNIGCPVLLTPGNHDFWNPDSWLYGCDNTKVLIDQTFTLSDGTVVYFTPWSMQFCDWAWMRTEEEQRFNIPKETSIVVSHGPAYGINDTCPNGDHAGSKTLLHALEELPRLQCVLTGHIHGWTYTRESRNGVSYQNISALNERYEPKGDFFTLEW